MPIRNIFPNSVRTLLWGDRACWGLTPNLDDVCWQEWQSAYTDFYRENQREGISTYISDAVYLVISVINLTDKGVLKPSVCLIGAIPIEGGFAWGLGRLSASRRWFKKNTSIDSDKIICWEHPNFADYILDKLDQLFDRAPISCRSIPWLPTLDCNLIIRLCYRKPQE